MDLEDLRAVTATATEPQVLSAYRAGLFPMGIGRGGTGRMGWWAPRRRGVLLPGDLRVSKSLRKSMRAFDFTVDTAFDDVIRACADPSRAGAWITREILDLYTSLHAHGWAHSVEVWKDGRLAGGLYGVAIGSLFAGESMFHRETDASKAALAHLSVCSTTIPTVSPRRMRGSGSSTHSGRHHIWPPSACRRSAVSRTPRGLNPRSGAIALS